jgi:hypothetical protein
MDSDLEYYGMLILICLSICLCGFVVYNSFLRSEAIVVVSGVVDRVELHGYSTYLGANSSSIFIGGKEYRAIFDVPDEVLLGYLGKPIVFEYGYVKNAPVSSDFSDSSVKFKVGCYFASVREVV